MPKITLDDMNAPDNNLPLKSERADMRDEMSDDNRAWGGLFAVLAILVLGYAAYASYERTHMQTKTSALAPSGLTSASNQ